MHPGLGPRGGGTHHVHTAGPAAAATPGRNAAPPRSRACKTAFSGGLTSMKAGRLPARRKGGRGAKGRDLGGHAPRCCSVSDWTREPSHFGFEAGGGKGRSQNTPLTPRRLLIGRGVAAFGFGRLAVELPARLACGLAVPGSASGRGCDRGGRHGTQVRRSATRLAAGAGGRASREHWGAAGPEPQLHLGPAVRGATSKWRGPTCAGAVAGWYRPGHPSKLLSRWRCLLVLVSTFAAEARSRARPFGRRQGLGSAHLRLPHPDLRSVGAALLGE